MQLRHCILAAAITSTLAAVPPARAGAQDRSPSTGSASATPSAQPYRRSFGTNPIGLPFGLVSAEYEHALSNGFSAGIGGSLHVPTEDDDTREGWLEGKLLYYPNEVPLRGFAVGITAGFVTAHGPPSDLFAYDGFHRTESAATLGAVLDYNWLLGRRKRFLVGLGIGAKRTLKRVDTDLSPLIPVYPDGRLTLGYAF